MVELTNQETLLAHTLKSALPKQAAAGPPLQMTTEQQAANAAANKERAAAAAARKVAAADNWLPPAEFAKLSDAERQAKMSAWVASKKESPGK